MCKIFDEKRIYSFNEIAMIASNNNLTTIDCIKDEGIISIEGFYDKQLSGESVFVFNLVYEKNSEYFFRVKWYDKNWKNRF